MSLESIHKAIYALLAASGDTSVGIRVAGTPTPCLVYEITSASIDLSMAGALAKNHWTIGVEVQVIGDAIQDVLTLVDDLTGTFGVTRNDATNLCSIITSEFSVVFSVEPLDDGREDAARIGTISLTLLVQED